MGHAANTTARKRWEQWYPVVLSTGGAIIYASLTRTRPFPAAVKDLYGALLTLGGTAIGFFATAATVLISMENRRVLQQLRRAGAYDDLLKYLVCAIEAAFAMSSACIVGILFCCHRLAWVHWWIISMAGRWFFVFICMLTGLYSYRIISLFFTVLRMPESRPD